MKLLAAGFVLSLLGSIPPGLISLSVAHTAIRKGLTAALVLALGAAFAEFFQAWIAAEISDWFLTHAAVERIFRWVALAMFIALGAFLIFFAKAPNTPAETSKISMPEQFFQGVMISTFNLLAIPYWFAYCGWLKVEGWWVDGLSNTLLFASGVTIGTIFALSLYAWLGLLIVQNAGGIARQANRLVGFIFFGLAIKLLVGLLK